MRYLLLCTWLAVLLLQLPGTVYGQAYDFGRFSIQEGLSQSQVSGITQDANGKMWFGTIGGGLCAYDGQQVDVFRKKDGLAGNAVQYLAYDEHNKVIYTSAEGHRISRYDGAAFTMVTSDSIDSPRSITGMITDHTGSLYVSTASDGLWSLSPEADHVRKIPDSPDSVSALALDDRGRPFLSTKGGKIFIFEHGRFGEVATVPMDKARYILSLCASGDSIVVGTMRGIYIYTQNTWQQTGPRVRINCVQMSENGTLWAGTQQGAIRSEGGEWEKLGKKAGLTDLPVLDFFTDREGNTWIASGGKGAYMFRNGRFRHFGEEHGLTQEVVMSLSPGPGGMWIGSSAGLFMHDGQDIKARTRFPLGKVYISAILPDTTGNIWVLSRGEGLVYYDKADDRYTVLKDLPDNYLTTGLVADDNTLWLATSRGLVRCSNGQEPFSPKLFSPGEQSLYTLWAVRQYGEGLLCGFAGGLRYFDGREFHKVPGANLIEGKAILGIVEGPAGRLYCNIYNYGLYVLDPATTDGYYLNTDSGLTSNLIYSMIAKDGYLYLGTERGIDRLSFSADGLLAGVRNYGREEGFNGLEANRNAVLEDSLGRLWFGNIEGIAVYDPKQDIMEIPEPTMALNGVRLFYETPDWTLFADSVDRWHNVPVSPVFPHDQNHLMFDFAGNSFVSPQRIRYRYRLEGFDKSWSPAVETRQAMYANLPPGDYTFRVEAIREGLGPVGSTLAYPFVIKAPIWARWWFLLLVGLSLLLLIKIVSDNRVRVKLEKAMLVEKIKTSEMTRLRKELARDFHDEIGNHFASISVLVQMLGSRLAGNKEVTDTIHKLEQLSRSLYLGGRDFIWSIEPENEQAGEMVLYIKDFGEELFESGPVTFRSDLPDVGRLDTVKLAPGANRQVIMIAKEAMTNTLKHSSAANVFFRVWVEDNILCMEICDDGCGMCQADGGHTRGLNNMKKRAERLGGTLSYLSNDKEGLTVLLTLPVNTV
ncbi:MAG: two-component regulator propeller domain-containing protein [Cyclobacteriaceae bacterium]